MSTTFAEQFAAFKSQKTLLVALLFLFVIVIFWTGLSLFGSQTKFAVPKEMRDLAKPLTPTIKEEVLTRIEGKRQFTPQDLTGFTIYKIIEDKDQGNKPRLVDISYVEEEVVVGTPPEAASGGLSTFLQANPDFETASNGGTVPDETATQSNTPEATNSGEVTPTEAPPAESQTPAESSAVTPTTEPVPTSASSIN